MCIGDLNAVEEYWTVAGGSEVSPCFCIGLSLTTVLLVPGAPRSTLVEWLVAVTYILRTGFYCTVELFGVKAVRTGVIIVYL